MGAKIVTKLSSPAEYSPPTTPQERSHSNWSGKRVIAIIFLGPLFLIGKLISNAVNITICLAKWTLLLPHTQINPCHLEAARQLFKGDIVNIIKNSKAFSTDQKAEIIRKMAFASELEKTFLNNLLKTYTLSPYQLEEIFKGAFVIFEGDGGLMHAAIKSISTPRFFSSHRSDVKQYSFKTPLVKELLSGAIKLKNQETLQHSWLQMEAHPTNNVINYFKHAWDFIAYNVTGANQGPYGSSNYTEAQPLRLNLRAQFS